MEKLSSQPFNSPGTENEVCPVIEVSNNYENPLDGDFSLPGFDNEVEQITLRENYQCSRGNVNEFLVEMGDGTMYPVVVGTPQEKNLRSDTAVVFTTPWMTSTQGHNTRTMRRMLKTGYPSIMIGPEGEENISSVSMLERFKLAAGSSLFKISHDMNRILDDVIPEMDIRQEEIITLGESRGAMEAPGFNIEQYGPERRVVYGDHTAPCFARAPKVKEIPGVVAQLGKEGKELGRLALQLPFQARGRYYMGTIHTNPEYYAKELFKIPQLMSGQAGTLARAARQDTPMHIKIFKGDSWSQAKEWHKIYEDNENVYCEYAEGIHLSIAQEETLDNIEHRLSALAEERGVDGSFDREKILPITALHKEVKRSRRISMAGLRNAA